MRLAQAGAFAKAVPDEYATAAQAGTTRSPTRSQAVPRTLKRSGS